ncbi:putative non-specific serine/threonine protein kinase [Helianthus annuus]|nr:putative non-specific serine/threonine protein kinase [Helianthus annuus]
MNLLSCATENQWIQNAHKVSNIPLGENIGSRIQQFSLMNKFKKKVITVVAENLPDEQVDGLKQMFDEMDKDKNGSLTFEEFKDGLCLIGDQPLDDPDVRMLMDAVSILVPYLIVKSCLSHIYWLSGIAVCLLKKTC